MPSLAPIPVPRATEQDASRPNQSVKPTSAPAAAPGKARRQKKWAPRSRTGCVTCRQRRVRCDETRPTCVTCRTAGHACGGYKLPPPLPANELWFKQQTSMQDSPTRRFLSSRSGENICFETEPPGWDFAEALRYYYSVVRPERASDVHVVTDPAIHNKGYIQEWLVSMVILTHIGKVSKSRGQLLQPGVDPALAGLWAGYHRTMASHLAAVNKCIAGGDDDEAGYGGPVSALRGIGILTSFEGSNRDIRPIQAHLNGYLALLKHLKGDKPLGSFKSNVLHLAVIQLMEAISFNSICPISRQVRISQFLSRAEMFELLKYDLDEYFPCPPQLLLCIHDITRARALLASGAAGTKPRAAAALRSMVTNIFARIHAADPVAWASQWPDRADVVTTVARVFETAIALYGIINLPAALLRHVPEFHSTSSAPDSGLPSEKGDCANNVAKLRTVYRERLMGRIKEALRVMKFTGAMGWPLIVAGVAAATAERAQQEVIAGLLLFIWRTPSGPPMAYHAYEKLSSFWRLGYTEWEECFGLHTIPA